MNLDYWRAVWANPPASSTQLLVLLCYADHANEDGDAFPAIGTIMRRCLFKDERHVRRVVKALARSGHLRYVGPHSDPRYRGAIVYRVTIQPRAGEPGVPLAGEPGVDGRPRAGGPGVHDDQLTQPRAGQTANPGLGDPPIHLEIQREREAGAESQECHMAERHDGEASEDNRTQSQGRFIEGKSGRIEANRQRIRDALRRKTVSIGNSEHFEDWLSLAREAGALGADEAIQVLSWMIDRSRACGEAVKYPSHCVAQILPGRAYVENYRKKASERLCQTM